MTLEMRFWIVMRYERNITPDAFPYMATVPTSKNSFFSTTIMENKCIFSNSNCLLEKINHFLCNKWCDRLLEREIYEMDHDF